MTNIEISKNDILSRQTTVFANNTQKTGSIDTFSNVLTGPLSESDMKANAHLRNLDRSSPDYAEKKREEKKNLRLWTPAAVVILRESGNIVLGDFTGFMQIDLDYSVCRHYHIEDIKQAFFKLPFVFYAGLSCSGEGVFIIMAIAEPDRLRDYFFHVADVLREAGIEIDRTNGYDYHHLRYVSYDPNALIKESVTPLKVKRFKKKKIEAKKPLPDRDYEKNIQVATPLVEAIESKELDFAPGYDDYVQLAFALADGTGEGGRQLFHRCCQYSPKYDSNHADYQYDIALSRLKFGDGAITFGTFIYRCKQLSLDSFAAFKTIKN